MRIVLWILLLLGLAFAVSRYLTRVSTDAREERDARRQGAQVSDGLPDGYGHAIIGEASDAPLVEGATPPAIPPAPRPIRVTPPPPVDGPVGGASATASHVVASGESLSKICSAHYGTGRADVVNAVAKFNHLASVDAIREGQKIALPPLASLGVEH